MDTPVTVERIGAVQRICMDRESKRNALTCAMYGRMADAMEEADADPAVRVVLLTGGDTVFTAGNDLYDFLDPERDASGVGRFLQALPRAKKPLVAAVNGYAIGIGTTMLLHCDLVYVGRSATLKMPFVDLGVVPECASSLLLPRLVGSTRASALLLLGEAMDGEAAVRGGIATEVLDDAHVQAHALARAQHLASRSPTAVQQTKALLRAETAPLIEGTMAREGALFAQALASDEAREAMSAIVEKREPDFSKF